MIDKLTFHNHPLKSEIIQRWDKKETNKDINAWLQSENEELVISIATLCKHHKRYLFNKRQLESLSEEKPKKDKKQKKTIPIEDILWETIKQCRKMKKDKTISAKDWQYLDQQLQSAIEKLIRIKDSSGETKDISVILAEIFAKIEAEGIAEINDKSNKPISEEAKIKIVKEVDDENKDKQESNTETS